MPFFSAATQVKMWGFPRASAGRGRQAHHESSIQVLSLCLCVCVFVSFFACARMPPGGRVVRAGKREREQASESRTKKKSTDIDTSSKSPFAFFCVLRCLFYLLCCMPFAFEYACLYLSQPCGGDKEKILPLRPSLAPSHLVYTTALHAPVPTLYPHTLPFDSTSLCTPPPHKPAPSVVS